MLELFELVLNSPYANSLIRQYTLTALCKFAIRLSEISDPAIEEQTQRIKEILDKHSTSQDLEIQQRSVEFEALFSKGSLVNGVLEHMPPPEIRATIMGTGTYSHLPRYHHVAPMLTSVLDGVSSVSEKRSVGSTRPDKDSLVDLLGDEGQQTHDDVGNEANAHDLLADIFGIGGSSTAITPKPTPSKPVDDIMSLFGNNGSTSARSGLPDNHLPTSPAVQSQQMSGNVRIADHATEKSVSRDTSMPASAAPRSGLQQYTAYEKNGLKITLTPKINPSQPGMVQILVRFTSSASDTLENVNFQAAVPKVWRYRSYS